jgi:hypothetical protein
LAKENDSCRTWVAGSNVLQSVPLLQNIPRGNLARCAHLARYPLSLRHVEDVLHEHGIKVSHESMRLLVVRFAPYCARQIRRKRTRQMQPFTQCRWHIDDTTAVAFCI